MRIRFIAALFPVLLGTISANSQELEDQCFFVMTLFEDEIPERISNEYRAIQLYEQDSVSYIIFTIRSATYSEVTWVISVKSDQEDLEYCIIGQGDNIEIVSSLHDNTSESRFGMPGSGYPRCGLSNSISDDLAVRFWANRELGDSAVFYFSGPDSAHYTLLIGEGGHWILLRQHSGAGTCYFARGERFNLRDLVVDDVVR